MGLNIEVLFLLAKVQVGDGRPGIANYYRLAQPAGALVSVYGDVGGLIKPGNLAVSVERLNKQGVDFASLNIDTTHPISAAMPARNAGIHNAIGLDKRACGLRGRGGIPNGRVIDIASNAHINRKIIARINIAIIEIAGGQAGFTIATNAAVAHIVGASFNAKQSISLGVNIHAIQRSAIGGDSVRLAAADQIACAHITGKRRARFGAPATIKLEIAITRTHLNIESGFLPRPHRRKRCG